MDAAPFQAAELRVKSFSAGDPRAIPILETALRAYREKASDPAALSYAGVLAAQRCRYTDDKEAKLGFLGEAFPLLDRSVRLAREAGNRDALLLALRNRSQVYLSVPPLFKKTAIGRSDADEAKRLEGKGK